MEMHGVLDMTCMSFVLLSIHLSMFAGTQALTSHMNDCIM